ncbi:glycosyltransferase [Gordonia iterans]
MRISLVIPCYNEASMIGECLASVAAQQRAFDEVIVVDNNSTDDSLQVVADYADRLPIRVLTEKRQGVAWASQAGYDAATGDVIARIDADSRLVPQWADVLDRYLASHTDVDGAGGFCYFYDIDKLNLRDRAFARADKFGVEPIGTARLVPGNNMAFRREAWLRARAFVKNVPGTHEDIDVCFALEDAGCRLASLPGLLVGLSARRFASSPASMARYLWAIGRTQHVHGRRKDTLRFALNMPLVLAQVTVHGVLARRAGLPRTRVTPVT